jgi:D-tyrosyl-tRNA(Tyr) deacylase
VVQRVLAASVEVDRQVAGEIDAAGLLVYLGVTHNDGPADVTPTTPTAIARRQWFQCTD